MTSTFRCARRTTESKTPGRSFRYPLLLEGPNFELPPRFVGPAAPVARPSPRTCTGAVARLVFELSRPSTSMGSLQEARDLVRSQLDEGVQCPCCGQFAKAYKRTINATMARSLVVLWKTVGWDWAYLPDVVGTRSREESKLRYWGLLTEAPGRRSDGGHTGYWCITDLGAQWVQEKIALQRYAHVYNGECLGHSGPLVSIRDALSEKFSLDELMKR